MPGGTTVPLWHGHPLPSGTSVSSPNFCDKSLFSASFTKEWHSGIVPCGTAMPHTHGRFCKRSLGGSSM